MATKNILIIAANGVEDVEFITPNDILTRSGFNVDIYYLKTEPNQSYIRTSYGLKILIENNYLESLKDVDLEYYDCLVIPGGPGYIHLDRSEKVSKIITNFVNRGKIIAAICAGPTIVAKLGFYNGVKAICYEDKKLREIMTKNGAIIKNPKCETGELCEVVHDGKFITALKMQSAQKFSYKIAEVLKNAKN